MAVRARQQQGRTSESGVEGVREGDRGRGLGVLFAEHGREVACMRASWSSTRREGSVPVGTVAAISKIQFYLKSLTESTIFPPLYLSDRLVI
jgi:hypothetical protein